MKPSRNTFAALSRRGSDLVPEASERFLPLPAVVRKVGASRASIYAWIKADIFPKARKIGPRRVAWLASDIEAWLASREAA